MAHVRRRSKHTRKTQQVKYTSKIPGQCSGKKTAEPPTQGPASGPNQPLDVTPDSRRWRQRHCPTLQAQRPYLLKAFCERTTRSASPPHSSSPWPSNSCCCDKREGRSATSLGPDRSYRPPRQSSYQAVHEDRVKLGWEASLLFAEEYRESCKLENFLEIFFRPRH